MNKWIMLMSVGFVIANVIMISAEYIGKHYNKEFRAENVRKRLIALICATVSAAVLIFCMRNISAPAFLPYVGYIFFVMAVLAQWHKAK
ncbi:MAG: hypothetical protein E7218_01620 [Anaerofustis stercorihominis]|nr:hypothetical protein [Anaerofustis stercorihominis]